MADRYRDETPLYESLCDSTVLNDYRLIVEGGRYSAWDGSKTGPPLLARLARFISGRSGKRRDRPIYELCHLIVALSEHGIRSEGEILELFLGLSPVTPATIRNAISRYSEISDMEGISHGDGKNFFFIFFRRAVFLFAVYEFLAQMEGCAYFGELNETFEAMVAEGGDEIAIRKASNAIARRLNRYRSSHFEWSAHAEQFAALTRFLSHDKSYDKWRIDDETIFDFWCSESKSGRFREYRTCFDAFARLLRVLEKAAKIRKSEWMVSFDEDINGGVVGLTGQYDDYWEDEDWLNPLPFFDEEPVNRVNFLKTASERNPLENLMRYGPQAHALAHAFLRLEVFAPIQSAISNDLRFASRALSLQRRLDMHDTLSYAEKRRQFEKLTNHIEELMKAVLHIVASSELSAEVTEEARKAFRKMRREGFEIAEGFTEWQLSAFKVAADLLPLISDQLRGLLACIDKLGREPELERIFESDREKFRVQLHTLYEGLP